MLSKQQIITEINNWILKGGVGYGSWYVGISTNARDRLFSGHGVHEQNDWWIFREAESAQVAREIEMYFLQTLKTDGGPGGGDPTSNMVYAYKKSANTRP